VIPKINRGGNTRGLLLYLLGKGRREEHVDPHLVAGSPEAMMLAGGRELQSQGRDAAQLARFLDEPRETFGTSVRIAERDQNGKMVGSRDAHVWHTSLSLHPDEPALSDERWGEIAERFVAEMGFAGEAARAQCRWVAVRHGDSVGGSDHVHLVVGLVAEDGSKASVHFDKKRAQNAARLREREFGLRELEAGARRAGSRGLEPGEIAADRRRGYQVGERGEHPERSSRQRLERAVRACAGASRNESEFVARLREHGVQARARYGQGGRSRVVGYSVRLDGPSQGDQRTVWYGGGRLARDLSLPALRRGWGQDHGETSRALDEWNPRSARAPRSADERRAELEDRGVMWHRCSMEIERVREQLRAAGRDPDAAAHAARQAAAVLASWSLAIEGENPGPLARASRQLARSAERRSQPAPAARRLSRASGLALFMLADGRPDSAGGWTLVCREIGLLGSELTRAHQARGELHRAREIEAHLGTELARVRAGLPQPPPAEPLDSDSETAQQAIKPLAPPRRERPPKPTGQAADEVEAVKRLIQPTRRRPPRQR